jgi:coenzyme F420-dependent glucose-6-phosphate dehydrogenase
VLSISYHVSHEQFSPGELLDLVQRAEEAGFDAAFSSDHLHPWASAQGHSGFTWAWLGSALQATKRLRFAGITVPGGWRYHPVIVAQALATLGQMHPGRLPWFALGSGESINERTVGAGWPEKGERNRRLDEAASIVRRLLAGERVSTQGHIRCENAQVWSRPEKPIRLVGAAMSERTAERIGHWADGLLTTAADVRELKAILAAFRRSAGARPAHLKVDVSWAPSEDAALEQAWEQWRFLHAGRKAAEELATPEAFEREARGVSRQDMYKTVLISADLDQHVEWLRERMALGFETLDLHNVGRNQREFIDAFSRHVVPALRSSR